MEEILGDISNFGAIIDIAISLVVIICAYIIFKLSLRPIKKRLLKKARTKRQITNVEIFSKVITTMFFLIIVIFLFFSYSGSWTGLGVWIGLLTAAIGWALQKPITGLAAWIMVVTKRPFEIGDRVVIGKDKGDVHDITLTHVYLREVGGLVDTEENSGRIILIPNHILFDENVINYTSQDDFVLNEVVVQITYESNLDEAMKIALKAAKKNSKEYTEKTKREPTIRIFLAESGIDVKVRFMCPARRLQLTSSKVTKEIFENIGKTKKVEIAYPHMEVIHRPKKGRK